LTLPVEWLFAMPSHPAILRTAALLLSLLAAGHGLAATFGVEFTNRGLPLEDPRQGKFYIYEEGEREQYLAWGYTGRNASIPSGTYDILIKY